MENFKFNSVSFGTLKVGDKFSFSSKIGNDINVVVKPSLLLDNIGSPNEVPFNSVGINDGRARVCYVDTIVYKLVKEKHSQYNKIYY